MRAKAAPARAYVAALRHVRREIIAALGEHPRLGRTGRGLARSADGGRPLVLANDRVDAALAAGVDGVHVGAADLPPEAIRAHPIAAGLVVGITCHTGEELRGAARGGADYVGLGPFFASRTKAGTTGDPRQALRGVTPGLDLPPVYAIGGVTLEGLDDVLGEPLVGGVVVSSAIQAAPDPSTAARAFRERLDARAAAAFSRSRS